MKLDLATKLQMLAHHHGCEEFLIQLVNAFNAASDDTEDFEDRSLCQRYDYYANGIRDLIVQEPEFSKLKNERDDV